MSQSCFAGPEMKIHEVSQVCKAPSCTTGATTWHTGPMESIRHSQESVEVDDEIRVYPRWKLVDTTADYDITADIVYDEAGRRFLAERVTVESKSGAGVTGATLREIKMLDAIQSAALSHVIVRKPDGSSFEDARDALKRVEPIEGRSTDAHAEIADRIYRIASLVGYPPLRSVADLLHVSQSTATRLVNRYNHSRHGDD